MEKRPQADLTRFAETQIDRQVHSWRSIRSGRQFPGIRESTTGFDMVERDV